MSQEWKMPACLTGARMCAILAGICALLSGGLAHAAEATIDAPAFPPPTQSFRAPVQTGTARCAPLGVAGLYKISADLSAPFCLGRALPKLYQDLVFVRSADDFYAGNGVVWAGALEVKGEPGTMPPPVAQGLVEGTERFTAVFRAEQDVQFQHNYLKDCAPNWYFPKEYDLIGTRKDENDEKVPNPVKVEVLVTAPAASGQGILRVALNSNAPPEKDNMLAVRLNETVLSENVAWKGPGYRITTLDFDSALLKEGSNIVELLADPIYLKYLDWIEIAAPAQPALRSGSLVVQANADATVTVPGARYAVDITEFGAERAVAPIEGQEAAFALASGRLYCFADRAGTLEFGPEMTLAEPDLASKDYVCVGLRDMLPALEPLLERKAADGLQPAVVALEDIVNVYNGGLFGPNGILAMIERARPKYLLLAGGFHRDCRARDPEHAANPAWRPGIPAEMRHVEQLIVSDDAYTLNNTIKVGRVPARTAEELAAWAAKAATHAPSDNLVLLAGQNKKADFSAYQRQHQGKVPTALLEADGRPQDEVRRELFDLMRDGARLVVYQGHAQSWEIDQGLLEASHAAAMPVSDWVLATCNAAYYHADYDVYVRDWMTAPEGGCVNAIASASVGNDDQQDQLVRRFVEHALKNPEDDWGGMMQYLKKNLPLAEDTMSDTNLPDFLKKTIARDRPTIDAYGLLGDPAAAVFSPSIRRAALALQDIEQKRNVLPPGPATVALSFPGPWDETAFAPDRMQVQWHVSDEAIWRPFPLAEPLHAGDNALPFDSATFGLDGGVYELRVIERRPDLPGTVWTSMKISQESRVPGIPFLRVNRTPVPKEAGTEAPAAATEQWVCVARDKGPVADPRAVQTQYQVRPAARPEEIFEDTGWQPEVRYVRSVATFAEPFEIRARCKRHGVEGEWSEWTPLAAAKPEKEGNAVK